MTAPAVNGSEAKACTDAYSAKSQPTRIASNFGILEAGAAVPLGLPPTPRLTYGRTREHSAASVSDVDLRRMGESQSAGRHRVLAGGDSRSGRM